MDVKYFVPWFAGKKARLRAAMCDHTARRGTVFHILRSSRARKEGRLTSVDTAPSFDGGQQHRPRPPRGSRFGDVWPAWYRDAVVYGRI